MVLPRLLKHFFDTVQSMLKEICFKHFVFSLTQFYVALFCIAPNIALSQPRYASEAAIFLPPGFDDSAIYKTFSQKELHSSLADKAGSDNSFVGSKVKVFARFHLDGDNWINKTRVSNWKQSNACQLKLCDSLERLTPHRNDLVSIAQGSSIDFGNFTTGAYFSDSRKYEVFLVESAKRCSAVYPCYIWISGKLGFVKGPRKYQGLVNLDLRIAYVEVEDVLMIDGKDNAMAEVLMTVVPIASRARAVASGFKSLFR